jgi:SAM-dependent methyltransferase
VNKLADFSHRVVRKIGREGFYNTIAQVGLRAESFWFDMRYGVDTHRNISLGDLEIASPAAKFGRRSQSTLVRHLRKVLTELKPSAEDVLVDFGCGKGRVLLVAAMQGLKRVTGVEFSPELCAIAEQNIARLQEKVPLCPVEVACIDAGRYQIRPDETIFFFFNPFDAEVMKEVISNIETSFENHPRKISIVYINIESQRISTESGRFKLVTDTHLNGLPLQIYALGWQLQQ